MLKIMKMKIKNLHTKLLVITFLLVIIFLNSCSLDSKQNRTIYSGTQGLVAEFISAIPDEVYEETSFLFGVKIKNQGTYSLTEDNPGVISLVTDKSYLSFDTDILKKNKLVLDGVSKFFPDGDLVIIDLPDIYVNKMVGAIQNPKTELYFSMCYPYETTFSENICIDFDVYQQDLREKACASKELSFSGGQGAPIAITKITPIMKSKGNILTPILLVEIENKGKGLPWYNATVKCKDEKYNTADWNKLKITGRLSTQDLVCEPKIVKLIDNKATIRCDLEQGFPKGTNFLSVINFDLDYNYIESISQEINILRMPGDGDYYTIQGIQSCDGKNPGDSCYKDGKMVCNETEECEDRCSYCARNNGKNNVCGNILKGFTCSCTSDSIFGLPIEEYELKACRLSICCNPGMTSYKIKYSEKEKQGETFSSFEDLNKVSSFEDDKIYRFKHYFDGSTGNFCSLAIYEGNNKILNSKITDCNTEEYFEINPSDYLNKDLSFYVYIYDKKDSDFSNYKFSSKEYKISFSEHEFPEPETEQESNKELLASKILEISPDDDYLNELGTGYCAAFIKRILRKAYGLDKFEELSTIGIDCFDSQLNGASNDAWDIAACFLNKNKNIYVMGNTYIATPLTSSNAEAVLEPGDLIFESAPSSWCRWSGYNYYKYLEDNNYNWDYCYGKEKDNTYADPETEGFCKQDTITFFEGTEIPQTCSYSENSMTYSNFPIITHIGIYLGNGQATAAYFNTEKKIIQGTVSDFISSVNADGIRLIVRPDYPDLSLD